MTYVHAHELKAGDRMTRGGLVLDATAFGNVVRVRATSGQKVHNRLTRIQLEV